MINKSLGLIALVLSLVIVFVWIPHDVESGLIEKVRRSVTLGDAFAPTIAAFLIGLGGLLILFGDSGSDEQWSLGSNTHYALSVLLLISLSLLAMRFAGPLIVEWISSENREYRLLRDTVPWKYLGYLFGGTMLVAGLIAWTERRLRFVHVVIGITATLLFIGFYDLPFEDLLLPPNGDV